MNPINARAGLNRAAHAKVQLVRDPGSGGTVHFDPSDLMVLVMVGSGARTLQPAASTPLGTRVLAIGQDSGQTLNGVEVNDGQCMEFIVCRSAAGANEWTTLGVGGAALALGGVENGLLGVQTSTATLTTTTVLGGFIQGTPGANVTYTLPTAAALVAAVAALGTPLVGQRIPLTVYNNAGGAFTITMAADAGSADLGTLTVAQGIARDFIIVLTDVTTSTESYILYGIG